MGALSPGVPVFAVPAERKRWRGVNKYAWGNSYFRCRDGVIHFVDQAKVNEPGHYICLCGFALVAVDHPSKRSKTLLDIVGGRPISDVKVQ